MSSPRYMISSVLLGAVVENNGICRRHGLDLVGVKCDYVHIVNGNSVRQRRMRVHREMEA